MDLTKKDLVRPIVGLIGLQPVVILYLLVIGTFSWKEYLSTGWGLQIAITIYLIFFYAWFERWNIWQHDA